LEAIMNAVPVGVAYSQDLTSEHMTGNPALFAQLEAKADDDISASTKNSDALGRRIRYLQDGRELSPQELPIQRAVAENREIPPMELEVQLSSGRRWSAQAFGAPIRDERGNAIAGVVALVDITDRKQMEAILRIERDVAFELNSSATLAQLLESLLSAFLHLEGADSGGIYLAESKEGPFRLAVYKGFSSSFVAQGEICGVDSPLVRKLMRGDAFYWPTTEEVPGAVEGLLNAEGLKAMACLPLAADEETFGVMTVGSHYLAEIPARLRELYESMAVKISGLIARRRMSDKLKTQAEQLRESNAALKVLLRQRDEDRSELEQSIVANARELVFPYLNRLKKTRITDEQKVYLEIIESHLKEITAPFVHKTTVAGSAQLTPMEIRVAELVRLGRKSKEIAEILITSEETVLFHRKNIRKKLGLSSLKVNLQSYLQNLQHR
jgi:DNA-binding CsgD family transcriptional regulator/PAS domain-containing protein